MATEHNEIENNPGSETTASGIENDLLGLLRSEIASIAYSSKEGLEELRPQAFTLRHKLSREAAPPAKPLEDPKIAYGYAIALTHLAEIGQRAIIPGKTIVFLLQNPETYHGLELLYKEPAGVMRLDDYLQQATPDPVRALHALTSLEERRLAADERRGGTKPLYAVRITSSGRAAAEFIELHQKDAKPTTQPTNPDRDLLPDLGNEISMLISHEREVSLGDQVKEGSKVTIDETIYRLGLARAVARRMTRPAEGRQPYDIATVRAWFLGMDPLLDDHSPALEIAKMELGDIKGITRILRASDAFLAE